MLSLGASSPTLVGRELDGQPRKGPHQHLHILPDGPADRDAIERVLLWAAEGFGRVDQHVLGMLRLLPAERGHREVYLASQDPDPTLTELTRPCRTWTSYSPFLRSRHPKPGGREKLEEQVQKECQSRGLPTPEVLRLAPQGEGYKLQRGPRQRPPGDPEWLTLTFPKPVTGPLCLGAHSHFGMGRFLPRA